jgi:hypothetical protein
MKTEFKKCDFPRFLFPQGAGGKCLAQEGLGIFHVLTWQQAGVGVFAFSNPGTCLGI